MPVPERLVTGPMLRLQPDNVELHYQVTEGPGTVFVKTRYWDTTSPTKNLLTSTNAECASQYEHSSRSVVVVSIAGQDPRYGRCDHCLYTILGSRTGTVALAQAQAQVLGQAVGQQRKRRGLRLV